MESIIKDYPYLNREDIKAALHYGAKVQTKRGKGDSSFSGELVPIEAEHPRREGRSY